MNQEVINKLKQDIHWIKTNLNYGLDSSSSTTSRKQDKELILFEILNYIRFDSNYLIEYFPSFKNALKEECSRLLYDNEFKNQQLIDLCNHFSKID